MKRTFLESFTQSEYIQVTNNLLTKKGNRIFSASYNNICSMIIELVVKYFVNIERLESEDNQSGKLCKGK